MAHLQTIDPSAETPSRELLAAVKGKMGLVPNMTKVMANSPAVLKSYLDFSGDLSAGTLSPKVREQLALAIAQENECGYCLSAHSAIGKMVGLAESDIAGSRAGHGTDAKTSAAITFSKAVLASKGHIDAQALDAVRKAGYGDGEIAEIIAHVALNVFTNFFTSATEPEIDFPKVAIQQG